MIKKVFLLFLFWIFGVQAQEPVTWETKLEKLSDTEYFLQFKATIEDQWHLYSQHLPEDGPLPTQFVFEGVGTAFDLIGATEQSEAVTAFDPIFEIDLSWFEGGATFKQKIRLIDPELAVVKGEINFQACDDKLCIFRNEVFRFVLDPSKAIQEEQQIVDSESLKKSSALQLPLKNKDLLVDLQDQRSKNSLFNLFLLGFIGGLIALLTPCVFPMIPLTVSFFTKQNKNDNGVFNAVLYGLFIFLVYLALSVPFHLLDNVNPDILNDISTNISLNIFFFLIFLVFAFSFFGFYELTLPSSWVNKSSNNESAAGIIGIFFMALTLAIVSFSCTGPILGSLLAGSLTGDSGAWELTAGMGGFGLALGLPFALFAMFPRVLEKLPKSGGWLNTIKVTLGFIELALALKFLSNADLVAHWGILKIELFLGLWVVIFLLLGFYLLGKIKFPKEETKIKLSRTRLISAILVFGFSLYLASGLLYDKEKGSYNALPLLSGLAPPLGYSYFSPKDCPNNLDCFKDLQTGITYAQKVNKPVLLDFTGYACVNCRKMEEHVWPLPSVDKIIRENYVLISLYVDDKKELAEKEKLFVNRTSGVGLRKLENIGHKWAYFQAQYFGVNSQPYYLLMDPNNYKVLNAPVGYTPNEEDYISFLNCGLAEFKKEISIFNLDD